MPVNKRTTDQKVSGSTPDGCASSDDLRTGIERFWRPKTAVTTREHGFASRVPSVPLALLVGNGRRRAVELLDIDGELLVVATRLVLEDGQRDGLAQ